MIVLRQLLKFIFLGVFTATLVIGCSFIPSIDQQANDTTNLTLCFPVMERLQLVTYGTGAQEIFHYRRGFLSKAGSSRTYFDGETRTTKPFPPFDAQAQKDLAELEAAIAQTGVKISRISGGQYDANGKLIYAEFGLPSNFAPLRYVYSPSYRQKPNVFHGQRINPISRDWYFIKDD